MSGRIVEPVSLQTREPAPPLPTGSLTAEKIPESPRPKPVSLIRLAMPIVMVVAVLGMVALMVVGGGQRALNPMMLMFPMMMLMSVITMFNPQTGGADPDEVRRTYLRHLKALGKQARDHGRSQRAHELHCHPGPVQLPAIISSRRLWEKASTDPDALEVRVGAGTVTLCTPIDVPDSGAPEDLDPVCSVSLRHTIHAVGQLPDMPVVIQLRAFRFLGLGGPQARDLARCIIMQLAIAHGPETVGVSVVGKKWDWLKWLPHSRDPAAARFHILIVDSLTTTGLESFVDDPDITTIIDVGALRTTALGIRAEHEGLFLVVDEEIRVLTQSGEEPLGTAEVMNMAQALVLARKLAPCERPKGVVSTRTRSGDLLSLLQARDVDDLATNLWPGRLGSSRLNVPVGVDEEGMAVNLDLKESAEGGDGPHGLCIGATGSGKSELLRTLVTSLAATHSPEELNLVLVDFKGGATFLGCEALPHTSAVITNLEDESVLVDRMFAAISGELNRRQEVLRKAGNFANVGDYNAALAKAASATAAVSDAAVSAGASASGGTFIAGKTPLPALVIVIDEFSELLGQHPDFADLFVAVGRLGRSLHVHLLLASQRLEEGRLRGLDSHLSYRFGLKTFSAAESRQVLGITDAYRLPSKPGAGFFRKSSEELVRFQASYVSGPLQRPVAKHSSLQQQRVEIFQGFEPECPEVVDPELVLDTTTTLLEKVVDLAREEATSRRQSAHKIWLPPLPAVVELPDVLKSHPAPLCAAIGLVDRPYQQRQDSLELDLSTAGGHVAICGGPQSGKSTAVRTVVCALAVNHPPGTGEGMVRFYIIDLGGGQLATLNRLPHVAAVARRNEPEKIRRIIDEVNENMEDSVNGGHTFLLVDGWHHVGTAGAEFEDLADPLTRIAADGPSQGVHLIITTSRWTTMRPAIRDLISHRLELRLGEAMESLIDRKAQEKLPAISGRGLNQAGEPILIARSSNQDIAHIESLWSENEPVPEMRMLPQNLELAGLERRCGMIPLGVGGTRLQQVDWEPGDNPHFVCVGSRGAGKSQTLDTVMAGIAALGPQQARMVIVDQRRAHLGRVDQDMVAAYAGQSAATEKAIFQAATTLRQRLPEADITAEQLSKRDWWEGPEIYVVIDDLDVINETSLYPLIELLPHSGDIGMHVVLARKSGGISRALFGGFLAAVKDQQPCVLVLDADKDEGPIFGVKPTNLTPGRGYLVQRGRHRNLPLIQVAQEDIK